MKNPSATPVLVVCDFKRKCKVCLGRLKHYEEFYGKKEW